MASVQLNHAWIHLASDLSTYVRAYSADWSDTAAVAGEVRAYAGGRLRIITRPVRTRTLGLTLRFVPLADVDTLTGWAGRLLMVRDSRGRLEFGTYFARDLADWKGVDFADVQVTFQRVTASAEV